MDHDRYEQVKEPERLWKRMLTLIAASYLLDGVMLGLFVISGVVSFRTPIGYTLTGLACCGLFYGLISSGLTKTFADSNLTLVQLSMAVLVQLAFMIIEPVATMYFVTVLYVIFGFASLRLKPREALGAFAVVAVLLALIFGFVPEAVTIPHETVFIRILVGVSILLALGKCTLLGLYSTHLRILLGQRLSATKVSLKLVEQRSVAVATSLHEGLGQELTGISLMMTALAARLRREGHPGAEEVSHATEHVCTAIETSRALADSIRPPPKQPYSGRHRV